MTVQLVKHGFCVPCPPSTNALYRNVPKVGRVKTAAYKAWQRQAGLVINIERPTPVTGCFAIEVWANPERRGRRDLDNLLKPTLDLIKLMGLIQDDSWCERVAAQWDEEGERAGKGNLFIWLTPWGES